MATGKSDGWSQLPEILLVQIYSYLPFSDRLLASLTCKHWRRQFYHPTFWKKVLFNFASEGEARSHFLTNEIGRFVRDCTVRFPCSDASGIRGLFQLATGNKYLQSLSLIPIADVGWKEPMNENITSPIVVVHQNTSNSGNDDDDDVYEFCTDANQTSTHNMLYYRSQRLLNHSEQSGISSDSQNHGADTETCNSDIIVAMVMEMFNGKATNVSASGKTDGTYNLGERRTHTTNIALKHLSLGCWNGLTDHNRQIVHMISQSEKCGLKSLHISRAQDTNFLPCVPREIIKLDCLEHLSIDMAELSDSILLALAEREHHQLKTLAINIHRHAEPMRNDTWDCVRKGCPDLKVTMNIMRCVDAMTDLHSLIYHGIPLVHFRAFFCDEINVPAFHYLAKYHCSTLESLHIMESFQADSGPLFYEVGLDEQDPFVMLAWKCEKLTVFSVIGVVIWEHDALAIARLRGHNLTQYELANDCIMPVTGGGEFEEDFNMTHSQFCEEISSCVGYEWEPLTYQELPPGMKSNAASPKCISAFLPLLQADQLPPEF